MITFANPGQKLPTDAAFASGATSDSGLTVSLTSLTPTICTVDGSGNIDPVAEGLCTVVASQAGNSSYAAAEPVTQSFPVSTKTPQAITFANPGTQLTNPSSPTVITVTPTTDATGLTVLIASLTPSICTVGAGGAKTLIASGTCELRGTQPGDSTYAPAIPVLVSFTVNVQYTLTYDKDGGSGTTPASQTEFAGTTLTLAAQGDLQKDGFTFGGWRINSTTYVAGGSFVITGAATAQAIWNQVVNYTLSFNGNGSDGGSVPADEVGNGDITLPGNTGSLTKSGYTFGGWTIGSVDYAVGATYSLTSNTVASAMWNAIPAAPPLPVLTFESTHWLIIALLLLVIGSTMVVYARRRA